MPITPRSGGIDGTCATPTISARSHFARSTVCVTSLLYSELPKQDVFVPGVLQASKALMAKAPAIPASKIVVHTGRKKKSGDGRLCEHSWSGRETTCLYR